MMPPQLTANGYASIRRSERLSRKATLFEQSLSLSALNRQPSPEPKVILRRASTAVDVKKDRMDTAAINKSPENFKRRSVRQSIRRSFQPIARMLSSSSGGKKAKEDPSTNVNGGNPIYENPVTMNRRSYRNTICVTTANLNLSAFANAPKSPEFRVPVIPTVKALKEAPPKPLPRTSLLKQENAPPPPPPRRRSSVVRASLHEPLEELRKLEPAKVLRSLREISVNSPKRKICVEPSHEGIADDENSFIDWNPEKKRKKTVKFQESSLYLLRGNDASSGKAKLQLCLYVNCGHISVHVIRGVNLPLLPDQHELNSYVKVTMEPKDCRTQQHRSQLVPGTSDPSYDFRLSFELPPKRDDDRSLLITVWHRDSSTRQSRLMGFLNFSVNRIMEANRIEGWFRLPSLAITKKTQL